MKDDDTRKDAAPESWRENPNGRVPLLELTDGRCLAESGAILWSLPWQPPPAFGQLEPSEGSTVRCSRAIQRRTSCRRGQAVASYEPRAALEEKRALVPEWHARGNAALSVMETHLTRSDWFAGKAL